MSRYRYLPWVREGAAHAYDNPDKLTPVLARTDGKPLSVMPVGIVLNEATPVDVRLRLYGPGDVVGIDPRAVLRTDPLSRSADFEPNYLACIEFDIPDFPWLFTPAAAGTNGKLRPWLVLAVVKSELVTLDGPRGRPLPQLDAPVSELPDLAESWAWAHAQVVELDSTQSVEQILVSEPARNLSRLVCPRRLEPETRYLACVVPAFEAGRKAGLGIEVEAADEDKLSLAWGAPGRPVAQLPVYYHWEFATGAGGDFETLARRLKPRPVGSDVGRRNLRVGSQPFGLPNGGSLKLEGALVATGAFMRPESSDAFKGKLRDLLNLSAGKPVVTPPIYGRWQSARTTVPGDAEPPDWLRELNLDPSVRAASGLGVVVIQEAQEQLVAAAWQQLGDPTAVAHLERRLEVAVAVLGSVVRRRVEPMDTGRLVQFLGPAQARLRMSPETLHAALARQNLPPSFSSASFRRLVRPGGAPSKRGFPGAPPLQRMATRMAANVPVVGAPPSSPGLVTQTELVQQVNKVPRTQIFSHLRYRAAASAVQAYVNDFFGVRTTQIRPTFTFDSSFKETLIEKLDPRQTTPVRFYARVSAATPAGGAAVEPPPAPGDSVLFTPTFPQPMYESLRDLSPEYLLPGVATIDDDTVTLLNDNPRFIEAYMLGLNHEFASELLWREFPSDMRGSFFRAFWDTRGTPNPMPQMPAIHTWDPARALGKTFGGGATHLVLLIRGELLHRYPDALIYAVQAATLRSVGTEERLPLFRGRIDPDITFLGFDLSENEARGNATDPGWFFVIQEQPTAPRFGLDEDRGDRPLDTWNDLAWSDVATAPGAQLKAATTPPLPANQGGLVWAFNGAHLAGVLRQRPVRIAIHARQLLPK